MTHGVFSKTSRDPESAFRKCEQLHVMAKSTGRFTAPKPLAYNKEAGTLELELIDRIVPLADVLPRLRGMDAMSLANRVGGVLAVLHGSWSLPEATTMTDVDIFRGLKPVEELVLAHGDYGLGNVCCIDGDIGRLVILDPEPAPFLDMSATIVTRPELDVALFASCLEGIFPYQLYWRYDWKGIPVVREELIKGYVDESGRAIWYEDVTILAGRLLSKFAHSMKGSERTLRHRLFGTFLGYRAKLMIARMGH